MDRGTYVAPPRPFIRKTTGRNRRKWTRKLFENGIEDTANSMKKDLQDSIKYTHWKPNTEFTYFGGWMPNRKSGKIFFSKGKGLKPPLVNEGNLINDIEIKIKHRSGRQ